MQALCASGLTVPHRCHMIPPPQKRRRPLRAASLYLLPAFVVLVLVGALPLGFVVFYAVHDTFGGNVFFWVGLDWFKQVLTTPAFYHALLRSLLFALIVLTVQLPLGVLIALKIPRSGAFAAVCLVVMAIPMLTPSIVVGYLWKVLIQPDAGLLTAALETIGLTPDMNTPGWSWTVLVLMDTWHWIGLVVLLCYARLRAIPDAYYQAALVDGASRWAVFRYIQLPRLKLVLFIAMLLRFMDSFTIYTEAYALTGGGPGLSTVFLSHELVQTGLIQFDLGEAGAMAVIYFAIVLIVAAVFYRAIMPTHPTDASR